MNVRLSTSQSPSRKCYTPSQTLKTNLRNSTVNSRAQGHLQSINFDRNAAKIVQCSVQLPKRQPKAQNRLLKTENYNEHLVFQGGRVIHSRNERIPSMNYSRKMSNRAVQKKTRSSSQTVDKENFYSTNLLSLDKKRTNITSSLNNSFNYNRNYSQQNTPNPGTKRSSLHNWANQHQITINSTKSTRKTSFQNFLHEKSGRVPSTDTSQQKGFVFLENQFQYNIVEQPEQNNSQVSDKIKHCFELIDQNQHSQALTTLRELDQGQLNPNQVKDVAYLMGLIMLQFKDYEQAIQQFARITAKFQHERSGLFGQVSLLSAVAYKKLNKPKESVAVLSGYIGKRPTSTQQIYYDALVYRGKLLLKMRDYQSALQDFQAAMQHPCEDQQNLGKLGKADALRLNGRKQESLLIYNALSNSVGQPDLLKQIYLRRTLALVDLTKYTQAHDSLDELLKLDSTNSEALFLKGVVFQKQSQNNEAVLSFEQAIKQNNSRKGVTKSLLEIAKTKIDQRDFYAAYYTLQRAQHLDVDQEAVSKMNLFTEGVVFLMKRKYSEGVNNFTILINNHQFGEFLRSLIFLYRAYGYICQAKYQKALNDLNFISNLQQLEPGDQFNKIICEGILLSQQNLFEKSIQTFQKATQVVPGRMEPYFYKSMALIKFVNKNIQKEEIKSKYFKTALQHLDQAVTINDSNSNLLYHRGLLRFYFSRIEEALSDFGKAIEKSEENVAKYFFARGLASACTRNDKQALNDFTVVINLDSKNADAYLNRAKIFQVLGDRNSAFNDLQKYISLKPHESNIHLWAGNLLFNIGAYDNAVKAYSHSNEINSNIELLQLRAHCYIILKELNSALGDLSRIIELTGDKTAYIDREALQSLKTASMGIEDHQVLFVQRFKPKKRAEGLTHFRLSSQMLKKLIQLNSEGVVFKLSDLYFYRGVYKFYLKSFDKAIEHWTVSYTLKQESQPQLKSDESKLQNSDDEFYKDLDDNLSKVSSQLNKKVNELEELEFEDRTYNLYEYYFNVSIAYLMKDKYEKAKEILITLKETVQDNDIEKSIQRFVEILNKNLQKQPVQQIHNQKQPNTLNIFPSHNRLCCIFPNVQLPFQSNLIDVRLSFCLPKITPPSMKPEFDRKLIENLSPEVVENKPEAPWIKRNQDGIVFTDNLQNAQDLDLKSESQRSENEKSNRQNKGRQLTIPDDDEFNECEISLNDDQIALESSRVREQNVCSGNLSAKRAEIKQLKERLQLDAKVKAKLEHLKQ